jgi:hypothetical protein
LTKLFLKARCDFAAQTKKAPIAMMEAVHDDGFKVLLISA